MKKLIYIFFFVLLACDSENAWDCIQESGRIIEEEFDVDDFERVLVNRDVELVLKQGTEYKVTIETGENLMNDISVEVINNVLQLTDNNTCNYVRDYGITKAYVTAPNIREIRSSSQLDVSSEGVISYDNLQLISEDFNQQGLYTVGDFRLDVNCANLSIIANNISSFYISGQVNDLFVGFYSGAGRFEGEELLAQHVDVFHRGSNDMIVNPQQTLTGELRGTGDLISVNQPPMVEVEQFYTGQLMFSE